MELVDGEETDLLVKLRGPQDGFELGIESLLWAQQNMGVITCFDLVPDSRVLSV